MSRNSGNRPFDEDKPLAGTRAALPYRFRPMSAADLPMLRDWLGRPHVTQWWGDADRELELLREDFEAKAMEQFIVYAAERPFAYIQCYDPTGWPNGGPGRHPPGSRGIDQFIGEPDMVGRGHGSAFIRVFIERLIAAGTPRVFTDPDPANARAIRAYEKAGFARRHVIDTSDGRALLMVRDA